MAMTLITTNPDSTDVATVSFTSSIDSTYKLFIFKFYDCNPASDGVYLTFQGSTDGGDNYNTTMTTTFFQAIHDEANSAATVAYQGGIDQGQGTAFQELADLVGNGADESCAGELFLFNPSNTTYVKHFYARLSYYGADNSAKDSFPAGYFNFTAALTNVRFKFASGNFDGEIKLWGVK